jgi:hypothetical protein
MIWGFPAGRFFFFFYLSKNVEMCFDTTPLNTMLQQLLRFTQSAKFNYWITIILFGCDLRSQCKIRVTDRSDIPKPEACFLAERDGNCFIDVLTSTMISGVLTDLRRPVRFLNIADTATLKFYTRFKIVFRSGTLFLGSKPHKVRNTFASQWPTQRFWKISQ